ncbi:sortase [Bifidobacterium hapali]|uniref:Sortase n=1 Tax=Bifidobacterium hapali TaxID=1630172 RepID=A0A261G0I3_9BIFI|nr:class C sortase [Bifidobacterium hapali]OZG64506.1 sortase [Bifidobacterium hapali]
MRQMNRPSHGLHRRGAHGARGSVEYRSYGDQTFAQTINVSDVSDERRRLKRSLILMRVFTVLLLVAAVCVAGFPLALQYRSSLELARTSQQSAAHVEGWPYPQAENALKAAHAYNAKLATSGQPILGEAIDPFSSQGGGSHAKGEDSAASKDKEYQSLLDAGNGVMGTIRVPTVSIELPIYHGTSEEALASGAGHLYGTSLPVGGASTHAVITGHRGLVEALMFTRLDEVKTGDFMYVEVMGETIGYQVDRISVILPDDTSQLKIVQGEDRLTLMTCTPYGVNTHRLLVSGHRVKIPVPAPEPADVHDGRTDALLLGGGLLLGGWLLVAIVSRMRHAPWMVMRHAAWRPRS